MQWQWNETRKVAPHQIRNLS